MKGLHNDEQAFNTLLNATKSLENRINEIYNLGYKQGYKDAVEETIIRMNEYVNTMLGRRTNEE